MPHYLQAGVDDPRTLMHKFRRVELQQVLEKEGVDEKKYASLPKETLPGEGLSLFDLITAEQIDLKKYIDINGEFTLTGRKVENVSTLKKENIALKSQLKSMEDRLAALEGKKK